MKRDAKQAFTDNAQIESGKRDAVRQKPGTTVDHSVAVADGTKTLTKSWPKARRLPGRFTGAQLRPVHLPKSGRGVGQSPTALENADSSTWDEESADRLIAFFRLLDQWERES